MVGFVLVCFCSICLSHRFHQLWKSFGFEDIEFLPASSSSSFVDIDAEGVNDDYGSYGGLYTGTMIECHHMQTG